MTALVDRWDITDHRDRDDSREAIEPAEPTEKADRTDPREPIDRVEPTEPMERNDPFEAMQSNESCDHNDHFDERFRSGFTVRSLPGLHCREPTEGRAGAE